MSETTISQYFPTAFQAPSPGEWSTHFDISVTTPFQKKLLTARRALLVANKFIAIIALCSSVAWAAKKVGIIKRGWSVLKLVSLQKLALANGVSSVSMACVDSQLIPDEQRPLMWQGLALESLLTCSACLPLMRLFGKGSQMGRCANWVNTIATLFNLGRMALLVDGTQ